MRLGRMKLTKYERELERSLANEEWVPGSKKEFDEIVRAIALRKKNAVLNIRINRGDLENIKAKARRHGVKYQTFIAELLHRVAHS